MAYARLENEILARRVRAGMNRPRRQGRKFARPTVTSRPGFDRKLSAQVEAGAKSLRAARRKPGVGVATVVRLRSAHSNGTLAP